MLTCIDHLVAATLANGYTSTFDLPSREDYLREYEAFLQLIAARRRPPSLLDRSAEPDVVRATSVHPHGCAST